MLEWKGDPELEWMNYSVEEFVEESDGLLGYHMYLDDYFMNWDDLHDDNLLEDCA